MQTTEKPASELATTNTALAAADQLSALLDQPTEVRVRGLARLCQQLSQQYQEVGAASLTRRWWRLFNQAGIQLREALDRAKTEGYPELHDQELEQAYFQLIHVAYFFTPGGVAQTVWPLLPADEETAWPVPGATRRLPDGMYPGG